MTRKIHPHLQAVRLEPSKVSDEPVTQCTILGFFFHEDKQHIGKQLNFFIFYLVSFPNRRPVSDEPMNSVHTIPRILGFFFQDKQHLEKQDVLFFISLGLPKVTFQAESAFVHSGANQLSCRILSSSGSPSLSR